ncbi:hypothetical protein JCM10213_005884 [Rhodosporidiobolus nylandii]
MPPLAPSALPSFLTRLATRLPRSASPSTSSLLPLLTATTLGHGQTWLRPCLTRLLSPLPPPPSPVPPEPPVAAEDAHLHPRRFAVAQLKEALTKSVILVGVPKVIETLLELDAALEPGDKSSRFVRRELEGGTAQERLDAGAKGLQTVYQAQLDGIFGRMRADGLEDIRYISQANTYGTFLTPFPSAPASSSPDPLSIDPRLLSVVTLSCLTPQRTEREILWHLRGAIRRGWKRDEVEMLQSAIEEVCGACGLEEVGKGMPRVADVEKLVEEEQ